MTTTEAVGGPARALARAAWQTILVTGILSVILGVLILVWPHATLAVAGVLFGIYLVVSGVLQLLAAFGAPASTGLRVLAFISGVLSIVLGVFCFRDEIASLLLLGIFIGIGWLFRGIGAVMAAVSDPNLPGRGVQGFFGVITALAGVVLVIWPVGSVATLVWVAGIWLVVIGLLEIATSWGVKRDSARSAALHDAL